MSLLRFPKSASGRALVVYAAIPVVMMIGVGVGASINPEVGARGSIAFYWVLTWLRRVLFSGSELTVLGLWYLTCVALVRTKNRSWAWTALAVFGPFGLIALTMLGNRNPGSADAYDRWVGRLNGFVHGAYQVVLFAAIFVAADQIIVLKRPLVVAWQSYVTGFSCAEILRQQDASSGMWAFGELLETLFLIGLLYLLWPLCFDLASRLPGLRRVPAPKM